MKFVNKPIYVFLLSVFILLANFQGHYFSSLSLEKFISNEFRSERFVLSRLIYDLRNGTQANGGFMLRYKEIGSARRAIDKEPWRDLRRKTDDENISVYYSHAGFQDDLLYPLWMGLEELRLNILEIAEPGSRWDKRLRHYSAYYFYIVTQFVVALINALVVGAFLYWVAKLFSPFTAWMTLLFILVGAAPISYYGRNMWWMMWSWFLPMLICLWGSYPVRHSGPGIIATFLIGCGMAAAIMLKVMMGYEFTSTVMVAAVTPVLFYTFAYRWPYKKATTIFVVLSAFCFLGFAGGFYQHWQSLTDIGKNPVSEIGNRFETRAHGGDSVNTDNNLIQDSIQASTLSVIVNYLISPRELAIPQILVLTPLLIWLWRVYRPRIAPHASKEVKALHQAFGVALIAGFFGAITMLVILKSHAYVHGYDIVVWYIPMNLFLYAYYSDLLNQHFFKNYTPNLLKDLKSSPAKTGPGVL